MVASANLFWKRPIQFRSQRVGQDSQPEWRCLHHNRGRPGKFFLVKPGVFRHAGLRGFPCMIAKRKLDPSPVWRCARHDGSPRGGPFLWPASKPGVGPRSRRKAEMDHLDSPVSQKEYFDPKRCGRHPWARFLQDRICFLPVEARERRALRADHG